PTLSAALMTAFASSLDTQARCVYSRLVVYRIMVGWAQNTMTASIEYIRNSSDRTNWRTTFFSFSESSTTVFMIAIRNGSMTRPVPVMNDHMASYMYHASSDVYKSMILAAGMMASLQHELDQIEAEQALIDND